MSTPTDDVPLPEGISAATADDGTFTLLSTRRDLGDIFALFTLGMVVVIFASAIGGKLFDVPGVVGALALLSPLWGWLLFGALARTVNRTRIVVSPGVLSLRVGPVGRRGSRELKSDDVGSIISRHFENRSSTRGGNLMITKTWSVWAKTNDGKELCLIEPLDEEAQARSIEKRITNALRPRKGQ